jgi:hypothetical protein
LSEPRRHRHRTEQCPACYRIIGKVRPSFDGGHFLHIYTAEAVTWNAGTGTWQITCTCGASIVWGGSEIKWRHPQQSAA